MRYFKFTQVDSVTGISWLKKQSLEGPWWPSIKGLGKFTGLSFDRNFFVTSEVAEDAETDPDNYITELTLEEYANEIKKHIEHLMNEEKNSIYQQENDFRNSIFNKYHDTASIAGIYKYEQAKELIADNTAAAPDVRAEAEARGVSAVVMANRIIDNHEAFRAKEAKIAGIRGKILDRIESFTFNMADPNASLANFESEEVIGTTTEKRYQDGEMVDVEIDVKVPKYKLVLNMRYQYE